MGAIFSFIWNANAIVGPTNRSFPSFFILLASPSRSSVSPADKCPLDFIARQRTLSGNEN